MSIVNVFGTTSAFAEEPAPPRASSKLSVPFVEGRPFAEVLARARAEKKPIMVDLYATWCGPCKLLDRTTFSDPTVGAWAKKAVVAAKIDAEKGEGRRLSRRYSVTSFPTILFLDASGNEIDRMMGAFPPESFQSNAELVLSGKGQLAQAMDRLQREWTYEAAVGLSGFLAQRNDVPRLRPIVLRIVREDLDLAHPETLDLLLFLGSLEDFNGSLSPETADMLSSFFPKLGSDPRRAGVAVILARAFAQAGDLARTKALVDQMTSDSSASGSAAPDLLASLALAQRKAGLVPQATASLSNAIQVGTSVSKPAGWLLERRIELAGLLAENRKTVEAEATLTAALPAVGDDPVLLSAGARVWLSLKRPKEAVELSRRAVESSQGETAGAQAALGASYSASGDRKRAIGALSRAAELAPDDPEIRKELSRVKGKA